MKKIRKSLVVITIIVLAVFIGLYSIIHMSIRTDALKGSDFVFINGNVITVDAGNPRAEAVVISGDKILFAGRNGDALAKAPENARIIDLGGKTILPGFNDNHTHTLAAGFFYSSPILREKSCEDIEEIVKREAAKKKPGELVTGNSWDYPTCPKPHKSILDRAAPNNPVMLIQYSGHAAWVNSMKLREMGIDKNTLDPKGGQIVRDESGEPTGILRDEAMGTSEYSRIMSRIISSEVHRQTIELALDLYRKAGITTVQDNTWEPFTNRLLNKYINEDTLTCRFDCWSLGGSFLHILMSLLGNYDGLWVRKGLDKYFADGAFSTRTAWVSKPYADEPGNTGSPRYTPEELNDIIMTAAKNRKQLTFHAIGDRAVHEVLNAVEKAQKKYPWTRDLRFRLEHVQIVNPPDIPRMRNLGVAACVQPFALCNPGKDIKLLGAQRARAAYPYGSLVRAGVHVSIGSDIPAEVDYQPVLNIYYAVTRKNKKGTAGPLNRNECLTPYEAIYCYTMGSAYAEFMEDKKGSITVGKLADLTVLGSDPTSVAAERIKDIPVMMTVVGGRIVFEKK